MTLGSYLTYLSLIFSSPGQQRKGSLSQRIIKIEVIYVKQVALWSIHCMQSINLSYYTESIKTYYDGDDHD